MTFSNNLLRMLKRSIDSNELREVASDFFDFLMAFTMTFISLLAFGLWKLKEKSWHLDVIATDPKHQRNGYGKILMDIGHKRVRVYSSCFLQSAHASVGCGRECRRYI